MYVEIVLLLVGAVLGLVLERFLRRPKLIINGGGGGGGQSSVYWSHASLQSARGGLGGQIRETIIWGRPLWGGRWWGWPMQRDDPGPCSAMLLDADRKPLTPLYWRRMGSTETFITLASLAADETIMLLLLCQAPNDPYHYFFFKPELDGFNPNVPPVEGRLMETREFIVQVRYAGETRKLERKLRVVKQVDGSFRYEGTIGRGSLMAPQT